MAPSSVRSNSAMLVRRNTSLTMISIWLHTGRIEQPPEWTQAASSAPW